MCVTREGGRGGGRELVGHTRTHRHTDTQTDTDTDTHRHTHTHTHRRTFACGRFALRDDDDDVEEGLAEEEEADLLRFAPDDGDDDPVIAWHTGTDTEAQTQRHGHAQKPGRRQQGQH